MITQTVVSENKGKEGYWVAFSCAFIVLLGMLLLPYNQAESKLKKLPSYQLSVAELPSTSLSMIAELRIAHEEILATYEMQQTWLSVEALKQAWISPFIEDKSWSHKGKHHWTLIAPGIYQSEPETPQIRYLLNNQNGTLDIWVDLHKKSGLLDLKGDFSTQENVSALMIKAGWTQIVFASPEEASAHAH